jgi:hypothetical protein
METGVPLGAWTRTYQAWCPCCFQPVDESESDGWCIYTEESPGDLPRVRMVHVCADPEQARELALFYAKRDGDAKPEELVPLILERSLPAACPFCEEDVAEVLIGRLRAFTRLERPEVDTPRGRARFTVLHRCASEAAARKLERFYERLGGPDLGQATG